MTAREGVLVERLPREDGLRQVRDRVLRGALGSLAIGVPSLSVLITGMELSRGTLGPVTIVLSLYTLAFPLLRLLAPRLGFRASALCLLGLLGLTAFLIQSRGGVAVGSIALNFLVLLLGSVFFGRRGAVLAWLSVVALFVLSAVVVLHEVGPPLTLAMWRPDHAGFWVRETVALCLLGIAIGLTQVFVIERLAHEAEREHTQRLALQQAEAAREHEREQRLIAQKALEESRRIEALARLSGGIAHDFNNALTVIMGTAGVLATSAASGEVKAAAGEIVDAAKRAAELTRQLLTLGRRQVSKPRPVPMEPLLTRLQGSLQRLLPSDVRVTVEVADPLVALVDPGELERALFNLAANAGDAMAGGGELRIVCRRHAALADGSGPGQCVELSVTDTGAGMSPEVLDRIFDPFFTTKGASGTGLGLATVYAFAKGAQGDVLVESVAGRGTTFRLRLPEAILDDGAAHEASARAASQIARGPDTHVLVVEDRDDVRASMRRIFARAGLRVSEAPNGARALELLERPNDYALLCVDGVMPGIATSEVLERVHAIAPTLRILLCSGYLEEDLLRRGVAAGRYAFLQKPFTAEDLLRSAAALLEEATAPV